MDSSLIGYQGSYQTYAANILDKTVFKDFSLSFTFHHECWSTDWSAIRGNESITLAIQEFLNSIYKKHIT